MLIRVAAVMAGMVLAAGAKDRGRELVEDVCTYCHHSIGCAARSSAGRSGGA